MIWYLGLFICAVISFILALRSMRDFQEAPYSSKETSYGLFLIKNTENLSVELFQSLINSLKGLIISFESLQKGESSVLIGFLPHFTAGKFPSLGLVEIEDYMAEKDTTLTEEFILARQISLNDSFSWQMHPKKKHAPELGKKKNLMFPLQDHQYAAVQIVTQPSEQGIQITARAIIKEQDSQSKIDLIKKTKRFIEQNTSLGSSQELSHPQVFEDYKQRNLIPRHVQNFVINEEALLNFIKIK